MTAFKQQWQEQKQQRQREVFERQQQVRETLKSFQQERQAIATQLRDDLSLFQTKLQQDTQSFLNQTHQQRQTQARQLTQLLHAFVQMLRTQTSEFLIASFVDRSSMAQQLSYDLRQFHTHLTSSVGTLRQDLKTKIRELQLETQSMLKSHEEKRLQQHQQRVQELTTFVNQLHMNVQTYLSELELLRQERAHQLQQMLKHDRDQRLAEMDLLFRQFSEFRAELQQYCIDLKNLVWQQFTPTTTGSITPAISFNRPGAVQTTPAAPPAIASSAITPAQPAATAIAVQEPRVEVPVAQVEPLGVINGLAKSPLQMEAEQLEKKIYNHVQQAQGARLTEIEEALGISRFQAVDALRSLIRQGLITQRDRIYLIQEEVSL